MVRCWRCRKSSTLWQLWRRHVIGPVKFSIMAFSSFQILSGCHQGSAVPSCWWLMCVKVYGDYSSVPWYANVRHCVNAIISSPGWRWMETWSLYHVTNIYKHFLRLPSFKITRFNTVNNAVADFICKPKKNLTITFIHQVCSWRHVLSESMGSLHLRHMFFCILSRLFGSLCKFLESRSFLWYLRASVHWWLLAKSQSRWNGTIRSKLVDLLHGGER